MKSLKYFTASWCGPCKMFKPTINELVEDGVDIELLDIDSNPEQVASNKIMSVPTLIFKNNGKEYKRISGLIPKSEILKILEA